MDFKDIYKTDFQITELFAMRQKWSGGSSFSSIGKPKRTDALLFLKSCGARYIFKDGSELSAKCGSTLLLPRGSEYKTIFSSPSGEHGESLLIEFTVRDTDGAPISIGNLPFILRSETPQYAADMFSKAVEIYSAPVIRYAELRSNIYSLIASFSQRSYKKDILSREFAPIADGILYLEQTPCPTKSISELAEMCHVSPAYFRRLFHKYASVSPVQYRNQSRIEYAKKLLEKNDRSISEIAEALEFEDTAYFCRAFKKTVGVTPGEYAKKQEHNISN